MSFVGLDKGEYREGQFGVDNGVAFADANSSEARYSEQLEQMDEAGITFGDLGIDPKNEKYGPNGLLPGASHINYDAAVDDLQSALDRYNSNLEADTSNNDTSSVPDSGISDEDRFVAAATELESRGVEFDLNNEEYYNDDNTSNYSALAAAAEAELASLDTNNGDAPASVDTGDVDGSDWFDAGIYKRDVNKTYNGNQIFYNGDATAEVLRKINTYISELISLINGYKNLDTCLDDLKYPYDGAPRHEVNTSIYLGRVIDSLEAAQEAAVTTIKQIVDAICNYDATGDTAGLTEVLSKRRSGGGGGGDPSPAPAPVPTFDGDDDLLGDLDNLGDEAIDEPPLENQEPSFDEDEKLIIPGVNNDSTRIVSSGSDSSLSSVPDETLELDGSSDIASSLDSVGTSFFGTDGKFFVPSVSVASTEKDKVNSAGVVGAGAVLAAASLAVGGKIYYDKKNEAENSDGTAEADDELIDNTEDSDEKDNKKEDEKDNTDDEKNNKSIFKSSGVKFKESIFGDGGDL